MCVVLQCLLVSCVRTQAACGCRCCVYMCELVVIKLSQGAQVKPLPWTVGTGNYEKWIISDYQFWYLMSLAIISCICWNWSIRHDCKHFLMHWRIWVGNRGRFKQDGIEPDTLDKVTCGNCSTDILLKQHCCLDNFVIWPTYATRTALDGCLKW